jgi:hypothetical protein
MICTPLILIVMQLFYINVHHIMSSDLDTFNYLSLSEAHRGAEWHRALHPQALIQAKFQVVIFFEIKNGKIQLSGQIIQSGEIVCECRKVCSDALPCTAHDSLVLNEVTDSIRESSSLSQRTGQEEGQ